MKRFTLFIFLVIATNPVSAQYTSAYSENFETVSSPDSITSIGNPIWSGDTTLFSGGVRSYKTNVIVGDTSTLVTFAFSTIGNYQVILSFDHICKIEPFDAGIVEVSADSGITWVRLDSVHYQGTSIQFGPNGNKFSEFSYSDWEVGLGNPPTNAWWKTETFDVSQIISNSQFALIRFRLFDHLNGSPAVPARAGWFIDNISVLHRLSETDPPVIVQQQPVLSGIVYSLGPYQLEALITDASGIASANLHYQLNGGSDSIVSMTNSSGNFWTASIPMVSLGDTICYYFECTDASPLSLNDTTPSTGCRQLTASQGIILPYFKNFDIPDSTWTDSIASGNTGWELGIPSGTQINSPFSSPNCWATNLDGLYDASSNCFFISPVFQFDSTEYNDAVLSFYQINVTEGSWDGFVLQYSIDAGSSWAVLGTVGDTNATNWYNNSTIYSSTLPGWSGGSGGWINSTYTLSFLNSYNGPVRFRYRFTSDSSVQFEGVGIDDFSIGPNIITSAPATTQNINNIHLYPIPIDDYLHVSIEVDNLTDVLFTLYSSTGQLVYEREFHSTQFNVPRGDLRSGIYFYRMFNNALELQSGKLILR